jgi:hypothetical protein
MIKKFGITALMALSLSALHADGESMTSNTMEPLSGGWVTGLSLTSLTNNFFSHGLLTVGYYGKYVLADVGASYVQFHSTHNTNVIGHLGLRTRLHRKLFISYGATGQGHFFHSHSNHNEWGVGAFTGLDYQLNEHFMISGKVYPYNYKHKSLNQVFANAAVSFFYVY